MKPLALAFALLFAGSASAQPRLVPVVTLNSTTWDAVVRVTCDDGSCGSGVLVKEQDAFIILTAAHVVRDGATHATIRFRNGKTFPSRGIFTNRDRSDSAAILIDDPGVAPVEIATQSPARGEEILACGYGGEGELIGQHNSYVGQRGQDIEMTGKIRSGDSGGPVFNNAGEVVGLNSASERPGAQGSDNYICSWHPLKEFLGRVYTRVRGGIIAQSDCPGGVCPSCPSCPQQAPRYSQPRPRGDVAPPPSQPAEPKPQPAPIDYEKLAAIIAAKLPKPKDGATGPAGPQGPPGEPGPSGKDGKDADLTAIDDKLKTLGFWVQTLDHQGKPFGEKKFVRLGQTLDIKPLAVPAPK